MEFNEIILKFDELENLSIFTLMSNTGKLSLLSIFLKGYLIFSFG
jgi:hypothetical protein